MNKYIHITRIKINHKSHDIRKADLQAHMYSETLDQLAYGK